MYIRARRGEKKALQLADYLLITGWTFSLCLAALTTAMFCLTGLRAIYLDFAAEYVEALRVSCLPASRRATFAESWGMRL